MEKKALIGMSGGVDSSVAARLTQLAGYICVGATMRLLPCGSCGGDDNARDAAAVAQRLGMEHHVLDLADDFRRDVMDYFASSYENGLTPNPCVECNRHLKFGRMLECARELGCSHIVTGHYARIRQDANGRWLLCKAADTAKDQTYFLYTLTQHQLAHTLMPLGELTKEQVRAIAAREGFVTAGKKDSQDICFVPDGDYRNFLQRHTGKTYAPGQYLDLQGNVVGTHKGAVAYTLGQRKGLGIALGEPVYVCAKDMAKNTVTVGPNEALFHRSLLAGHWNWIAFPAPDAALRATAKARSRMTEAAVTVTPQGDGIYRVTFDDPQRAITPGQAIVLYDGDTVLGGGTIIGIDN